MIVDMRLRPPLESWKKQLQFKRTEEYYSNLGYASPKSVATQSIEDLLKEMDEAEVEWGVIMGRQSESPLGVIPNDEIAACIATYPKRFVGWAGLDLSRPIDWCLQEIDRCLKIPGFKGISIEPTISRDASISTPSDRRLYPIYEECQKRGVPLNITLSAQLQARLGRAYEHANPLGLYQAAIDFPKLQIHIAHAAWPYVMEMIGIAFVCPNIWLSPDQYMIPRLPGAGEYAKAIANNFKKRATFGTAYPSRPHKQMVQEYRDFGFEQETLMNLFRNNALRLMQM